MLKTQEVFLLGHVAKRLSRGLWEKYVLEMEATPIRMPYLSVTGIQVLGDRIDVFAGLALE